MSNSRNKENWEIKTLEDVSEIVVGKEVTKAQLGTGDCPSVKCGDINSELPIQFSECINFVDENLIKNKRYCEYGDILMSNMSNKLETLGKVSVYLNPSQKCLAGDHVVILKHTDNPKYIAYALSSEFCRKQIKRHHKRGIVCELSSSKLKKIKVPIPSRCIQDKIADHLDKLLSLKEELKRELTSELKERIKQYQYYLNLLIVGREEEGKRKGNLYQTQTIGEIAKVESGKEITRTQLGTGDYPAIKCGDVNSGLSMQFTECISFVDYNSIKNKRFFEYGDILVSKLSNSLETIGKAVVYLNRSQKCLMGEGVSAIKHNQNPKYLTYALSTEFCRDQIKVLAQPSTVFNFFDSKLKQIQIPLPSLEDQEKIVYILDKFHEACGNLSTGIPKLIEEVEKQYQYYRDKIISY